MLELLFSPVLQELKEVGKEQSKVEAELPANVSKNRYPHVLPCKCCLLPSPPASRVGARRAGLRDRLTLHHCQGQCLALLLRAEKGLSFHSPAGDSRFNG